MALRWILHTGCLSFVQLFLKYSTDWSFHCFKSCVICFMLSALLQAHFPIRETISNVESLPHCRSWSCFSGLSRAGRGRHIPWHPLLGVRAQSEHAEAPALLVNRGQSAGVSDGVRKSGHTNRRTKRTHTCWYLLAIFLRIQGQTNIQTRAAQTSDSAKVMRKMAHMGSISNPSTAIKKQTQSALRTNISQPASKFYSYRTFRGNLEHANTLPASAKTEMLIWSYVGVRLNLY